MKTTYKLHTDKTYMKNTYLIKKDEYGIEVFIIVNDQNIKLAYTYTKSTCMASAINFVKSIENFVSIETNFDLESKEIETRVDFEYSIYMESNNRDKYLNGSGATSGFRIINPEDGVASISIMFEKAVECGVLSYAA